jgi:hypothetical protein
MSLSKTTDCLLKLEVNGCEIGQACTESGLRYSDEERQSEQSMRSTEQISCTLSKHSDDTLSNNPINSIVQHREHDDAARMETTNAAKKAEFPC